MTKSSKWQCFADGGIKTFSFGSLFCCSMASTFFIIFLMAINGQVAKWLGCLTVEWNIDGLS